MGTMSLLSRRKPNPALDQLQSRLDSLEGNCLSQLEEGLALMVSGDYTADVQPCTRPIDLSTDDPQVAALITTFNAMLNRAQNALEGYNAMREQLRAALGDQSCLTELTKRLNSLNDNCLSGLQRGLAAVSDQGDLSVDVVPVTTPLVARDGRDAGALAEVFNGMLGRAQGSIDAYNTMRGDLATVATTAQEIASGDLVVDVSAKSDRDALGNAFSDMTVRLRTVVGQVSDTAIGLRAASDEMARSSEETHRAIEEIAHAVADVASGSERQMMVIGGAQQVAAEVVDVTTVSEEKAQNAREAAADARSAAEEGAKAVAVATEAMSAVRESSSAISATMEDLARKGEQIGGIVDAITGIAEQTNLLALNAAIEAARAGDQGRGFAVVADEVRKLAEGSQQAARSIGDLIGEMQGETQRALAVVQAGAAQTEDGAATVEQARESFLRIDGRVSDVGERVEEISAAVRRIASASTKMQEDMGDIVSVAQQSTAATEQVSASTQETSASAQEIASGASDLARRADSLAELVATFRVA
jgi:methyl-accepting chemotaxis protein